MSNVLASLHRLRSHTRQESGVVLRESERARDQQQERLTADFVASNVRAADAASGALAARHAAELAASVGPERAALLASLRVQHLGAYAH